MSVSTIEQEMAQVVAEMSVISEASAAQLGDVVHGGERDHAPRGPRRSMGEEHAARFARAGGPESRRTALTEAREALIRARVSPRRQFIPGTLEWKLAIVRAEGSVEQVSIVYGCSRQTVYRLRAQLAHC